VWNTLPADRIDFSFFAAFERTVQQIDFSTFLLCFSGLLSVSFVALLADSRAPFGNVESLACQACKFSVVDNPVRTRFHVYVITFCVYVFMCENKDDDDDDDEVAQPLKGSLVANELN